MKGICKVLIIGLLVVASSSCGRKGETPAGATEFSTGVSELSSGNMGQGGAALPQLDSLDCRSGKVRSGQFFSTLLTSLGLSNLAVDTAIRVSFSAENSQSDVDALVSALKDGLNTLQKIK